MGILKEVYFGCYCKRCKHWCLDEQKDPCNQCLTFPANDYSHKPYFFEEAEKKAVEGSKKKQRL